MNEKNDKKEKQRTRKNRIFFRVDDWTIVNKVDKQKSKIYRKFTSA